MKELLAAIGDVAGREIAITQASRRPGDTAALVADNSMARDVLGWVPRNDLSSIVSTAWKWHAQANR